MNDFRQYKGIDYSIYLSHYGVGHDKGGHSGRYPWGSGDRPRQSLEYDRRAAYTAYEKHRKQKEVGRSSRSSEGAKHEALVDAALKRIRFVPTKEQNYERNKYMPLKSLPKTEKECRRLGWDNGVASDCHQFTSKDKSNTKWVSPDGRFEVIFDKNGKVVVAPEDYGTYNYADPNKDPLGHFMKDVVPWIAYGNSADDSTTVSDRLNAFLVDGSFSMGKKVFHIKEKKDKSDYKESNVRVALAGADNFVSDQQAKDGTKSLIDKLFRSKKEQDEIIDASKSIEANKKVYDNLLANGFKSVKEPETRRQLIEKINPYAETPEGQMNCVSCSIAYTLRSKLGLDVQAVPLAKDGVDPSGFYKSIKNYKDNYIDGDTLTHKAPFRLRAHAEKGLLKNYPEGSAGVISVVWLPWYGGGGHAFNWEIENGKVVWTDAQRRLGSKDISVYFENAFYVDDAIRLDNAEFNAARLKKMIKVN